MPTKTQPELCGPHTFSWLLSVCCHAVLLLAFGFLATQAVPHGLESNRAILAIAAAAPAESEYFVFHNSSEDSTSSSAEESAAAEDGSVASSPFPSIASGSGSGRQMPEGLRLPDPANENLAPQAGVIGAPRTQGSGTVKRLPQGDYSKWIAQESARLQSEMPRGEPVQVSLFGGPPSVGRSFVFVLDRSKSMGGNGLNALAAAGKELTTALTRLEPVHRFTVIAYHQRLAFLDGRKLLPATSSNQQLVEPFLNGLTAFGQTEHDVALLGALRLQPDVIYLFTDGGVPHLTEPELNEIRRAANEQHTTIHCIQFGFGPLKEENGFLERLAVACSGGFTYVDMSKN